MWPKRRDDTRPRVEYVETCPQCDSRKIAHKFGLTPYLIMGILYVYECPDCGYRGIHVNLSKINWSPPLTKEDNER